MKTFLRTGSFYKAETPSLSDDLDITELFSSIKIVDAKGEVNEKINDMWRQILELPPPVEKQCSCKTEIQALNERIDILTELVNSTKENDGTSKKVVAKPVVKSGATSKAGKKNDKSNVKKK